MRERAAGHPLAVAIYRRLLKWSFPADFRRELGDEMVALFRQRCEEEGSRGRLAMARLWLRTLGDLVVHGWGARRDSRPRAIAAGIAATTSRRPLLCLSTDIRDAVRGLARAPRFLLIAAPILALCIGANTAIFSLVDAVLLKPLPFPEPDRLVSVWRFDRPRGTEAWFSYPDYADIRRKSETFAELAAFGLLPATLTGLGEPTKVRLGVVAGLGSTLRLDPLIGRSFTADDEKDGERIVLLGHRLWQQQFGGEPDVIGATVEINREPFTVVGVTPPVFDYPDRCDLWTPLRAEDGGNRGMFWLRVIGRLADGRTLPEAGAELETLLAALEHEHPGRYQDNGALLRPLREELAGDVRPTLLLLLGAIGLVLVVACSTVAHLILTRAALRLREVAVRSALGASRGRLVTMTMAESLLLSLLAGGLGLLLANGGIRALTRLAPPGLLQLHDAAIDLRVLSFALGLSLGTTVLCGLTPAMRVAAVEPVQGLKQLHRGTARPGTLRRSALLSSQLALAVMLLIGVGLLVRTLGRLQAVDRGFRAEGVVVVDLSLPLREYQGDQRLELFFRELQERVARLPAVESVGAAAYVPFGSSMWGTRLAVRGRPVQPRPERLLVNYNVATPGYFETLGIPLLEGRTFTPSDGAEARPVAVVNERLARRLWPEGPAVGGLITRGDPSEGVWVEVIGVVGDARNRGLTRSPREEVYQAHAQLPFEDMSLVVRTGTDPAGVAALLRATVHDLDPKLPAEPRLLRAMVSEAASTQRFTLFLLGLFAALATILALAGVYGVVSYTVGQRVQEIGLRLAIGASRERVLVEVLRFGFLVGICGLALGALAAWAASRLLRNLLFEITPTDPATYAAAGVLCLLIALGACVVPALRASRVDPINVLRAD